VDPHARAQPAIDAVRHASVTTSRDLHDEEGSGDAAGARAHDVEVERRSDAEFVRGALRGCPPISSA